MIQQQVWMKRRRGRQGGIGKREIEERMRREGKWKWGEEEEGGRGSEVGQCVGGKGEVEGERDGTKGCCWRV